MRGRPVAVLLILGLIVAIPYFAGLGTNPPGFFIDESSIAYNAWTIATTGRDEYGHFLPLYFRAFGEYKNPTYIYGLAAVWKLMPPSNEAARAFSAAFGVLNALALGWLAFLISRRTSVAALILILTAVSPMNFELTRVVFEVAMYPFILTLFFIAVWRASEAPRWTASMVGSLVVTLALVTYTYSIGRLLGPLFAAGLIVFLNRTRVVAWATVLGGYFVIGVLPIITFQMRNPEFSSRFRLVSVLGEKDSAVALFVSNYFANLNPATLTLRGDPIARHHVWDSGGSILAGVLILAIAGVAVIFWRHRSSRFWWFVVYATLIAAVPASLTRDVMHSLRLSPLVVMFLVLSVPVLNLGWSSRWVALFVALTLLASAWQVVHFQSVYRRAGPLRWKDFDTAYPILFLRAIESERRPIVLVRDDNAYVHGLWYGVLANVDPKETPVESSSAPASPEAVFIASLALRPDDHPIVDAEGRFAVFERPAAMARR